MARSPRKISLEHIVSLYIDSIKTLFEEIGRLVYIRWTGQLVVERRLDVTCCVPLECLPESATEAHRSSRRRFSFAWHDAGSIVSSEHLNPSTKLHFKAVFHDGCG